MYKARTGCCAHGLLLFLGFMSEKHCRFSPRYTQFYCYGSCYKFSTTLSHLCHPF